MKSIKKLVVTIRQKMFEARLDREIYRKIFPHLRGDFNHGYRFQSDDEIVRMNREAFLTTESTLRLAEQAADKMPKSEGEAFKHIMHRDLQRRMWQYVMLASERIQPDHCEARHVATRVIA